MTWLPIDYREFYDLPRLFAVRRSDGIYVFDCAFDAGIDDYEKFFSIYRLEEDADLATPSWDDLIQKVSSIGRVPVTDVRFDETRRQAIDEAIFKRIRNQ